MISKVALVLLLAFAAVALATESDQPDPAVDPNVPRCFSTRYAEAATLAGGDVVSGDFDAAVTTVDPSAFSGFCQAVFPQLGNETCCGAPVLQKLGKYADKIAVKLQKKAGMYAYHVAEIVQDINQVTQLINQVPNVDPTLKDAMNTFNEVAKKFGAQSPGNFNSCSVAVRDYIVGGLCSVCRVDFIGKVLKFAKDNSTSSVRWLARFFWHQHTCDYLSQKCGPFLGDFDEIAVALWTAINTVRNSPTTMQWLQQNNLTQFFGAVPTNKNLIRPCYQMAVRSLGEGAVNPVSACAEAACYHFTQGVGPGVENMFDDSTFDYLQRKDSGKRSGGSLYSAFERLFTRMNMLHQTVQKRDSTNSPPITSTTFVNSPDAVDAAAVGQGSALSENPTPVTTSPSTTGGVSLVSASFAMLFGAVVALLAL